MGRLLEIQELAKLYGITPNGARTWIAREKVNTVIRVDTTFYLDEEECKALVKKMFMTKYEKKVGADHILCYLGDVQILLRGTLCEDYFGSLSKQEYNWILKYALKKTPKDQKLFYIIIGPVEDEAFERFIEKKNTFLISTYSAKSFLEKVHKRREELRHQDI